MTGNSIVVHLHHFGRWLWPRSAPPPPAHVHDLNYFWRHPSSLPTYVTEAADAQRLLTLLGPLHWSSLPERDLVHNQTNPTPAASPATPATPTANPVPAAGLAVGEYYWGYGSGLVVVPVPGSATHSIDTATSTNASTPTAPPSSASIARPWRLASSGPPVCLKMCETESAGKLGYNSHREEARCSTDAR